VIPGRRDIGWLILGRNSCGERTATAVARLKSFQMQKRLAVYNFGMFREPADSAVNQSFRDLETPNFLAAERAAGFVGRAGYAGEPDQPSWGEQVYPRFYVERGDGGSPSTLSLWESLESLFAFAYSGIHAEAIRRASDWLVEKQWPAYVLWWAEGIPDWRQAVTRFERLHDCGPSPEAFNFKTPFDQRGDATTIDRDAVRRLIHTNRRLPQSEPDQPD
jgi:hypothetical protein